MKAKLTAALDITSLATLVYVALIAMSLYLTYGYRLL